MDMNINWESKISKEQFDYIIDVEKHNSRFDGFHAALDIVKKYWESQQLPYEFYLRNKTKDTAVMLTKMGFISERELVEGSKRYHDVVKKRIEDEQ